jgi:hypothetical protein
MDRDGDDRKRSTRTLSRRNLLATGVAVGVSGLAGCSDSDEPSGDGSAESDQPRSDASDDETGDTPAEESTPNSTDASNEGCTPGYDEGDPACQQVADAVGVLTPFPVTDTDSVVSFDHPCGWQSSTAKQFKDRFQANSTRNSFGSDDDTYVDVQMRVYYQPVSEGFLEEMRTSGNYDHVGYEYDDGDRTAIVSSPSSAAYGTVAHATVTHGERLAHVEFVSTFKTTCDSQPRPDYDMVVAMVESLGANPETTFSFA